MVNKLKSRKKIVKGVCDFLKNVLDCNVSLWYNHNGNVYKRRQIPAH
jgi:hypothetical protein